MKSTPLKQASILRAALESQTYNYKGKSFTRQEIDDARGKTSFDDYLSKNSIDLVPESEFNTTSLEKYSDENFQNDPANVETSPGSNQDDTVSSGEDISLDMIVFPGSNAKYTTKDVVANMKDFGGDNHIKITGRASTALYDFKDGKAYKVKDIVTDDQLIEQYLKVHPKAYLETYKDVVDAGGGGQEGYENRGANLDVMDMELDLEIEEINTNQDEKLEEILPLFLDRNQDPLTGETLEGYSDVVGNDMKTLFSSDDDEGVDFLEDLFVGTNIKFEESFNPGQASGKGGDHTSGSNVIKVSIPGGKYDRDGDPNKGGPNASHIYLDFNTDVNWGDGDQVANSANIKILREFIEQNIEFIKVDKSFRQKKEDVKLQSVKLKNQVFESPAHILEVKLLKEKLNRKNLEDANSEASKLFEAPVYGHHGNTDFTGNKVMSRSEGGALHAARQAQVKDLQKRFTTEELQTLITNNKVDNLEQLAEVLVLESYKTNEVSGLRVKNLKKAIGAVDGQLSGRDEQKAIQSIIFSGDRFKTIENKDLIYNSEQKTNEITAIATGDVEVMELLQKYAVQGHLSEKEMERLKQGYIDNGIMLNPGSDDYVEQIQRDIDENGIETSMVYDSETAKNAKELYSKLGINTMVYNKLLNEENELRLQAAEENNDLSLTMSVAAANYSLGEKYLANVGLGATDIVMGTGNLLFNVATLGTQMDEDTFFTSYQKTVTRTRNNFVRDVSFDDAFSSLDNFVGFAFQEISNQIPIIATMVATGGYGGLVIGVQSAGQKQMDLNQQLLLGDPSTEGYDEDFLHYSMWMKSIGYGLAEGGFAHLTTVPIIARSKKIWRSSSKDLDLLDNTFKSFAKKESEFLITAPLAEMTGEILTIGAQNFIDDRDFTEGMDHAGFSGFAFGLGFSVIPFMRGAYNSKFSTYNDYSDIRNDQKKLQELQTQYNVIKDKRTKAAKALEKQISTTSVDIFNKIERVEKVIKNRLRGGGGQAIVNARQRQVQLQNEANDILNIPDSEMSRETKQKALASLQATFNANKAIIDNALSQGSTQKLKTEFDALEINDKESYNNYIARAKDVVDSNKNVEDSDNNVQSVAYEFFLEDKIKKSNKKTMSNGLSLTEVETKDDAKDYADNLLETEQINDDQHKAIIKGIDENADGFAIPNTDVTVAIVENQILNQQEFVGTHEIGHQAYWKIFGSDFNFDPISSQLLDSMKKLDKATYIEFMKDKRIYLEDGVTVDPKEVISVFLEYVAANKFTTKEKASGLAGLFGSMTQKSLESYHDFDFAGEADMYNFAVGLGKKISSGTLTMEDISKAKENKTTNEIVAKNQTAPSDIALSSGTNLDGMLNDFANQKANVDRRKKGLPLLPKGFELKPERKRQYIRGFVNDMLSRDVNGNIVTDFMKSKLVAESNTMGPYITTISNRIWNGLDPMNREGQTLDTWKQLVATELSTMIQQEYLKPNKDGVTKYQDLDKFVRNRGYFRVFELATNTFKQTAASLGLETVGNVADTELDLDSQKADLDAAKKLRDSKVDFVNKVKFIDSNNKAVNLPNSVVSAITNNIVKTFKTKKFKNKLGTNKFRTELANEYGGSIGTMFKNVMQRGENFDNSIQLTNEDKRANYSQFLSENFDLIYDLPIDVLNKKYPFLVNNTGVRMNAEQIRGHNDAIDKGLIVGKKITDIKSGPFIFEKVKDKKKAKIDYLNYFEGANMAANTKGARQLSLADTMGQESAYDMQGDVLKDAGFKTEAFIQELNKNVGRVAFSSVRSLTPAKRNSFYASIPGLVSKLTPGSTNWGSQETIQKTFKSILTDLLPDFTPGEISKISTELAKYAMRFNLIDPVVKKDAKDNGYLEEYFENNVLEAENKALKTFLNLEESIVQGFENDIRIQKHRAIPLDYIRQFDNDPVKQRQAIIDVIQNSSMYAGAGKIGDGRYQVFAGISDFYKHLNTLPGVEIDIANSRKKFVKTINSVQKWTGDSWLKIDGKAINPSEVTLIPETSESGLKDNDFAGRLKQANNARRYVKDMVKMVVDGNYDNMDLAMLMKQLDSQMSAPLKRAANLEYVVEGLKAKDARYEHMMPTNFVLMNLVDYYKNNRANADQLADKLFKEYKVAIIPRKMDDFLTKVGLQSKMNLGYKIGDPVSKRYYNIRTWGNKNFVAIKSINPEANGEVIGEAWEIAGKSINKDNLFKELAQFRAETKAVSNASTVAFSKTPKGISVWDFDDTLAQTKSNVLYTLPDGTKGKIDATQFALQSADLETIGAKFDFSEFSKVMKGKKGPFFEKAVNRNKKFGNENVFILTARPQDAAPAIHTFLKGIGLDIRLQNIVGLSDGTAKAKADWMITKIADGYNDFYFADDAIKNVKAVKQIYDNFDVKGKVALAKVSFSKGLSQDFNDMMERQKGVDSNKIFSEVVARRRGKKQGRFKWFVPPSAEDFRGLTQYTFAGKGKQGNADQKFFEEALMDPYFKGVAAIEAARQSVKNDVRGLLKMYKPVVKKLNKLTPDGDYTYDSAIRVYLWTEAGLDIPGISKRDQKKLHDLVSNDTDLSGYAAGLLSVSKVETWPEPGEYWDTKTTLSDIQNLTDKVNRKQYLAEFIENVDAVFSQSNLNKIEALYGKSTRSAIEDSIYAMKTGSNRTQGQNAINNAWLNWVNNSVGTIMFFNRRSAVLQLLSATNFINWSDNNVLNAGLAFANQPQYWKDFAMIFNSDKLKQRRGGLKSDVQEAEIANAAKNTEDKANAVISYLLKIGFTPTQLADSFAIASGGASFYRNRVKTYIKKGMSKVDAEAAAFEDFSKVSDEAQQSGDPALVSQQQRSTAGRLILAFQNTPMQYTRLMKKAGQDIVNGRGDFKTNFSKILYYGAVQNLIFNALQQTLFALIPGFDDEEIEDEKLEDIQSKKQAKILNGMIDSVIRGTGIYGAIVATIKNTIIKFNEQEKKGFTADHTYTVIEAANVSPPIGSKLRKIYSAIQTYRFDKDVIKKHPWEVMIDGRVNPSPTYQIIGNLTSALINLPLDRLIIEAQGISEAFDSRNTAMQRIALALGWRSWGVGADNEEFDEIKADAKARRKVEGIEKGKQTRKDNKLKELLRYNNLSPAERAAEDAEKKRKRSESAKKGAVTRKENKRIKDSIQTADLIKLLQK